MHLTTSHFHFAPICFCFISWFSALLVTYLSGHLFYLLFAIDLCLPLQLQHYLSLINLLERLLQNIQVLLFSLRNVSAGETLCRDRGCRLDLLYKPSSCEVSTHIFLQRWSHIFPITGFPAVPKKFSPQIIVLHLGSNPNNFKAEQKWESELK